MLEHLEILAERGEEDLKDNLKEFKVRLGFYNARGRLCLRAGRNFSVHPARYGRGARISSVYSLTHAMDVSRDCSRVATRNLATAHPTLPDYPTTRSG